MESETSHKIRKFRNSPEYKKWREKVLKKDNRKCVLCGSREDIEVDHIKSLALFPELALREENGRVLCHKCHVETDTYGIGSRYSGELQLHPILLGDVAHKINLLPNSIFLWGKDRGLKIEYNINNKKWLVGYSKLSCTGEDIPEALNSLFKKIKKTSLYNFNFVYKKLDDEIYMVQQTTKILRQELYKYIEEISGKELKNEEKQKISEIFRKGVRKLTEEIIQTI